MAVARPFTIAHISDLHCGSPYFVPNLMDRAIIEVNDLEPDVVIVSGDLTTFGFRQEYVQARAYLDRIECPDMIVVPGNHDSRNVGYVHFEEHFGARQQVLRKDGVCMLAIDSSEPDLDHGVVGRVALPVDPPGVRRCPARLRIFILHHHLLPIPGTGRERNVVYDAGDALEVLAASECRLVLSGHKHVPHAWRLEDLFVVNAGTVSTLRTRGKGRPCYNIVEVHDDRVDVHRAVPVPRTRPDPRVLPHDARSP